MDYDTNQIGWFANTSRNRPIRLNSMAFFQNYFDGHIRTITSDVTASPTLNITLTVGFTNNRVDVPAGRFTANLARLRLAYAFSTRLITDWLIQYNHGMGSCPSVAESTSFAAQAASSSSSSTKSAAAPPRHGT